MKTLPLRTRLGDESFRQPHAVRSAHWDRARGLVLLESTGYYVLHDTRSGAKPEIGGTTAPPILALTLIDGDRVMVDGDSIGREDAISGEARAAVGLRDPVAAAFDPDEGCVAVLARDGRLCVLDTVTLSERSAVSTGPVESPPSIDLCASGSHVSMIDQRALRVVDVRTGEPTFTHTLAVNVRSFAVFVHDDLIALAVEGIASAGGSSSVRLSLLDPHSGRVVVEHPGEWRGPLTSLARLDDDRVAIGLGVTPDGERRTGWVEVWDVKHEVTELALPIEGAARVTPHTGRMLVVGHATGMTAWDLDAKTITTPVALDWAATGLFATERGIVVVSYDHAALWEPTSGALRTLDIDGHGFGSVSTEGDTIVSRNARGELSIRSIDTGEVLRRIGELDDVQGHARGGSLIAMTDLMQNVVVVDVRTGESVLEAPAPGQCDNHLELCADGATLAVGVFREVPHIWDVARRMRRAPLRWTSETHGLPLAFTLSRGGTEVVIGTDDGAIHRFDVATGLEVARVATRASRIHALAVSSDGCLAVCSSYGDPVVRVVSLAEGRELATCSIRGGAARAHIFSRDERSIIVAAPDATVSVFDIEHLRELAQDVPATPSIAGVARPTDPTRIELATLPSVEPWRALPPPLGPDREVSRYGGRANLTSVLVGRLSVPSGELVAGDLSSIREASALEGMVARGSFPVFGLLCDGEPVGLCVQLAEPRHAVVSWTRAGVASTDSAAIVVADRAIAALARTQDDAGEELLSRDVLTGDIPSPGVALFGNDARGRVAAISTMADGGYPVLWGRDAQGAIVALRIDCALEWPDTHPTAASSDRAT